MTRNEASDFLSCSSNTLQNYERRGVLHPQYAYRTDGRKAGQRLIVYSPEELTKLKIRMKRASVREPGEVAARAFELFSEEKKLTEIVIILRAPPETIQHLHEQWLDMDGARCVISPVAKEALQELVGPFESIADLVERVAKLKPAE
jgi:DNA-binding transcriptional MerR regulator